MGERSRETDGSVDVLWRSRPPSPLFFFSFFFMPARQGGEIQDAACNGQEVSDIHTHTPSGERESGWIHASQSSGKERGECVCVAK